MWAQQMKNIVPGQSSFSELNSIESTESMEFAEYYFS